MISWMQKHNRYLVWTIWIATIAFIGAGFVGWGSYNFGSRAGNVAKVGDIEIPQSKLNMVYSNLYNRYNRMFGGKLDEKKAKEMGLVQQAFAQIETQAKILNLAKDIGIIVSDKEVADYLQTIPAFQKDGVFNKTIYKQYLQGQRIKARAFEESIRDELAIQKALTILDSSPYPYEEEVVAAAMNAADKIAYKVLTPNDITIQQNEEELKKFWQAHKENYKTAKKYNLSIVWTGSDDINVTDKELKNYYDTNSFKYTDKKGKQLSFEDAKKRLIKDLQLKKAKKKAQKSYIAFKKGKLSSSEEITLSAGDRKLSPELWSELQTKKEGSILKPKVVGDYYATVKINEIILPKVMSFENAKPKVESDYTLQTKQKRLRTVAEKTLTTFNETNATHSQYLSFGKNVNLQPLSKQESLQFLQKLFTSNKEKGMISIGDKIVIYKIEDQKLLSADKKSTPSVKQTTARIKKSIFENNLIQLLDKRYPTEVYIGGLKY